MSTYFKYTILLHACFLVLLTSCGKKRVANPLLSDQIYQDIKVLKKSAEESVTSFKEQLKKAQSDRLTAAPNSMESKIAQREITKFRYKLSKAEKAFRYYQIREKRRSITSVLKYEKHFKKDLPWPDQKEIKNYAIYKKLLNSPKSWNSRVPKLKVNKPSMGNVPRGTKSESKDESKGEIQKH